MNTKAKGIGMIHSKFDSPSWLSQNNVSTPTDLEKLIIAILNSQYPIWRKTENESVKIRWVKWWQVTSANGNTIRKLESQDHEILLTKTWYIRPSWRCEITVIKNPQWKIYSMLLLKAASDGRRKKFTWNTGKALETKT
jgi:D-alanyl-D-alanine endopeptidase (penicillin-binding protein 7)